MRMRVHIGAATDATRIDGTHHSATSMEVPTLSEFKLLLKRDHVFRDYFNTFLSLPVRNSIYMARNYAIMHLVSADIFQEGKVCCGNRVV